MTRPPTSLPPRHDDAGAEPDIVITILERVRLRAPAALSPDVEAQIEREIRAEYGGLRVRIPKRGKHLTEQQREHAYRLGLGSASNQEVQQAAGISRATLYRLMKRPTRGGQT